MIGLILPFGQGNADLVIIKEQQPLHQIRIVQNR